MVLKHTTKDETESPLKKETRSDAHKHDTKRGKVRKEEKNSESSDNSRRKASERGKMVYGGNKVKYPAEPKNGSEINVDKDDTSLSLPKPSSSTY